jgi:hypothetical protein
VDEWVYSFIDEIWMLPKVPVTIEEWMRAPPFGCAVLQVVTQAITATANQVRILK